MFVLSLIVSYMDDTYHLKKFLIEAALPLLEHYEGRERVKYLLEKRGLSSIYKEFIMEEAHKAALFRPKVVRKA